MYYVKWCQQILCVSFSSVGGLSVALVLYGLQTPQLCLKKMWFIKIYQNEKHTFLHWLEFIQWLVDWIIKWIVVNCFFFSLLLMITFSHLALPVIFHPFTWRQLTEQNKWITGLTSWGLLFVTISQEQKSDHPCRISSLAFSLPSAMLWYFGFNNLHKLKQQQPLSLSSKQHMPGWQ